MPYIPYKVLMKRLQGGGFEELQAFPERYYVHPVEIIKNLYYVGDKMVCIHLIDTGDGLILLDAGYPTGRATLIQAIWESGHNPADIKYVVLTHEHYDHFGAAEFLRTMFGCKIIAAEETLDVFQNHPERALIDNNHTFLQICPVDITVKEGDVLELGNVKIRFLVTPGHGEGVLTMIFDMTDYDGTVYRCGLLGGATTATMYREHLKLYGIRFSIWDDFIHSLDRLHSEKIDINLGNHPRQNKSLEKIAAMGEGKPNPFIDPTEWDRFLDETKAMFEEFMRDDLAAETAAASAE